MYDGFACFMTLGKLTVTASRSTCYPLPVLQMAAVSEISPSIDYTCLLRVSPKNRTCAQNHNKINILVYNACNLRAVQRLCPSQVI